MALLVTVDRARRSLRLSPTLDDPEVTAMVEEASEIIRAFVTDTAAAAAWDAEAVGGSPDPTVPAIIQRATLLQISDLYVHRGDERSTFDYLDTAVGRICPGVERLLRATGYRDPVVA